MAPSEAVIGDRATARLRAASRESLAALVAKFDEVTADLGPDQLSSVADDLASVAKLLAQRAGADASSRRPGRRPDAQGRPAGDRCPEARSATRRWTCSRPQCRSAGRPTPNLVDAVEHVARLALLVRAEREDRGRRRRRPAVPVQPHPRLPQPRLATLLSDYTAPAEGRVKLLHDVLDGGAGANATDGPAAFADGRAAARRARRRRGARPGRARGGPPRRGGRARQRRGRPQPTRSGPG
mgnify:CR=1 FL=1